MGGRNRNRKKNAVSTESESEDNVFIDPNDFSEEQQLLLDVFEQKIKVIVKGYEARLAAKDKLMDQMSTEIVNLKKKVQSLDDKLEDAETYERRDTVVFSGSELPSVTESEDCTKIVIDLLKDKVNYFLRPTEISVAHRLGQKTETQKPDKRNIIVKLCRREIKNDIMKACRVMKPRNLYANESLTKVRSTVLYGLRQAKSKYPDIVAGCGSFDGKIFAWIKPPKPKAKVSKNTKIMINTKDRFLEFCDGTLKCDSSDLVTSWPIQ